MTAQNQAFVAGDSKLSKNLKFADICHQSYWSHQNKWGSSINTADDTESSKGVFYCFYSTFHLYGEYCKVSSLKSYIVLL